MFTINPNKNHARRARDIQSARVKKSVRYLVEECVKKINYNELNTNEFFDKLNELCLITPEIHHFHHVLQSSMRSQNIVAAKKALVKLTNAIFSCSKSQWISISSIGATEWEAFIVNEAITLTLNDCGKTAVIKPVPAFNFNIAKDMVTAALCTIARYDSQMFDEIKEQVNIIKLFEGEVTMGLTDVRMLGAMFIRLPRSNVDPALYFLEHIVHEASHIHLNCLMANDPCILNLPTERFTSPLRADMRPMIGVFHATFVSARVARTLMQVYLATGNEYIIQPLAESLDEVIRGMYEVETHALLTPAGEQILGGIKDVLQAGLELPVWSNYDFSHKRTHRFGSGITKINELQKLVA